MARSYSRNHIFQQKPADFPVALWVFYLMIGPSDFELLRRNVRAAFLLKSKEERGLMLFAFKEISNVTSSRKLKI